MADYQFGKGAGDALFDENVRFVLSKTKRVRQVYDGNERLVTVRARDGFFTLSIEGAEKLHKHLEKPNLRVSVADEAVPFVSGGKTAFAKHVLSVDPKLRAGEEIIVTDKNDNLIATGQLLLAPEEIINIKHGPAVRVRNGINKN
ncbi:MAG: pseudouridine synthase [Methanosarcinaceae archaeon]|nr:pseudouridine synthase [Methanosarcinaceae archaeon]